MERLRDRSDRTDSPPTRAGSGRLEFRSPEATCSTSAEPERHCVIAIPTRHGWSKRTSTYSSMAGKSRDPDGPVLASNTVPVGELPRPGRIGCNTVRRCWRELPRKATRARDATGALEGAATGSLRKAHRQCARRPIGAPMEKKPVGPGTGTRACHGYISLLGVDWDGIFGFAARPTRKIRLPS